MWVAEENTYSRYDITSYTKSPYARPNYPLATNYEYDSLDRLTKVTYPAVWGMPGNPRRTVNTSYDEASRLGELKVDNQIQMSEIVYNPMSQVTSLKTGAATAYPDVEEYSYQAETGLLTNQTVRKVSNPNNPLLNLEYYYDRGSSKGSLNGKTG